jgi:hypothetical protein
MNWGKQPSSKPIVYQATALATVSTVTNKFSSETFQIRVSASQPIWLVTGDTSTVNVSTGAGAWINGGSGAVGEFFTVSLGQFAAWLTTSATTGWMSITEMS